jgi:hypothetical protein
MDKMECMCLQCGISSYLDLDLISVEDDAASQMKIVMNLFCPECGGTLCVRGRAGDEPYYKLQ